MKYVIIIILFTGSMFGFDTQWEYLDSAKTSKDYYYDLKCADSLNCFVWNLHENNKHTLRRTVNGGYTWENVYYNNSFNLRSITYPHKDLFIAAGDSMILRTTNQGDSWDTITITKKNIRSIGHIQMLDNNYGFLSGCLNNCRQFSDLFYFETFDGGITWQEINMPFQFTVNDFKVFSQDTVFIRGWVPRDSGSQKLYNIWAYNHWKTFDTSNVNGLTDIHSFVNQDICWVAGGFHDPGDLSKSTHQIIHSTDGLKTWETQLNEKGNGCRLLSIKFFDENFGMATTCMAKVYFTVDGGKTWHTEVIQEIDLNSPYDYALRSLQMPTRNTAYVISSGQWVLKFNGDWTDVEDTQPQTKEIIISPNPASDYIEISGVVGDVKIYDVLGIEHPATSWHPSTEGNVRIDISALTKRVYFVKVGGQMYKFVKL